MQQIKINTQHSVIQKLIHFHEMILKNLIAIDTIWFFMESPAISPNYQQDSITGSRQKLSPLLQYANATRW